MSFEQLEDGTVLKGFRLSSFPRPEIGAIDFAKSDCSSSEWPSCRKLSSAPPIADSPGAVTTASFIRDRLKLFSKNEDRLRNRPRSLQPAPDTSLHRERSAKIIEKNKPSDSVQTKQETNSQDSSLHESDLSQDYKLLDSLDNKILHSHDNKPKPIDEKPNKFLLDQITLPSPMSSGIGLLRSAPRENNPPGNAKPVREQLAVMSGQIKGFESQLLTEIEQRKQASAGRLAQIRDAVNQLRRTLEVEVQRRIVMQKELHTAQTKDIENLKNGIQELIEERKQHVTEFVDQFNSRLALVESQTGDQLAQQEAKLARIAKAVDLMATQIESFKSRLTSDIQLRRQRSEALFEKLAELEKQTHTKASIEAGLRERDREAITKQVAELKEEQLQATNALQDKLGAEFKLLKDTLEKETKAREQADDDIVKALNHYTVALQNALRIANA